jgi:hypothetical protein
MLRHSQTGMSHTLNVELDSGYLKRGKNGRGLVPGRVALRKVISHRESDYEVCQKEQQRFCHSCCVFLKCLN